MLLSNKHKLGFVHIPKTAGTSLRVSIEHLHDHFSESLLARMCRIMPGMKNRWPFFAVKHYMHLSIARLFTHIDESKLDDYRFFAVSRHPVKWMTSYYLHVIRHHRTGNYAQFYPEKYQTSFDAFIKWYLEENYAPLQTAMITNIAGIVRVDYVAKQEHLEKHLDDIFNSLQIPKVTLPRRNAAPSGNIVTPSAESIRLIEDYFSPDYEVLGYESDAEDEIVKPRGQIIQECQKFYDNVSAKDFDPWRTYPGRKPTSPHI